MYCFTGSVCPPPPQMWVSVPVTPVRTGAPVWRASISTSAPVHRTGVGLSASTGRRQVCVETGMNERQRDKVYVYNIKHEADIWDSSHVWCSMLSAQIFLFVLLTLPVFVCICVIMCMSECVFSSVNLYCHIHSPFRWIYITNITLNMHAYKKEALPLLIKDT